MEWSKYSTKGILGCTTGLLYLKNGWNQRAATTGALQQLGVYGESDLRHRSLGLGRNLSLLPGAVVLRRGPFCTSLLQIAHGEMQSY